MYNSSCKLMAEKEICFVTSAGFVLNGSPFITKAIHQKVAARHCAQQSGDAPRPNSKSCTRIALSTPRRSQTPVSCFPPTKDAILHHSQILHVTAQGLLFTNSSRSDFVATPSTKRLLASVTTANSCFCPSVLFPSKKSSNSSSGVSIVITL